MGSLWRRVLGSSRTEVASDVKEELEFHLSMLQRDLVRGGMSEEDAHAEALRRFGDVPRVEHETLEEDLRRERTARRTRWLGELGQDVRFAWRQLRRSPAYAVWSVLILALGLGATAAVFRLVDAAMLRRLPIPAEERVVRVFAGGADGTLVSVSYQDFAAWRDNVEFLGPIAGGFTQNVALVTFGEAERVVTAVYDPALFDVLGLAPTAGRAFTQEDVTRAEPVVMLSESEWERRFDRRRDAIGQTLNLNGDEKTIVGVMPASVGRLVGASEAALWVPMVEREWMTPDLHFMRVYARLADGIAAEALLARSAALDSVFEAQDVHGLRTQPIRESLLGSQRTLLLVLFGSVLAVLAIVCANLANLTLSHSVGRTREFAVRAAIGAGRGRLVRQLLTESAVIGLLGSAAAVGVAALLGGALGALSEPASQFAATSPFDGRVFAFTVVAALGSSALFGSWPAWRAARSGGGNDLRETGDRTLGGRAAVRRRRLLVGVEIALSVVLLAGAGLLVRSLARIMDQDPGFEPSGTLAFSLNLSGARYQDNSVQTRFYEELLVRLRALPGVEYAGAGLHLPLGGSDTNGGFDVVGMEFPEDDRPEAKKRVVTPGWFSAMQIPVLRGRDFTAADREGARDVVIVSRSVAERYWPGADPIGQRIRFLWGPGDEQEVVGVVGDVRHDGLHLEAGDAIYRPLGQFPLGGMTIVLRTTTDPYAYVPRVREAVRSLDAQLPVYNVSTVQEVVSSSLAGRRTLMRVLGGFAVLALILACLGVYAIAAQSVAGRRREIGLRMAVGATTGDVQRMVLGEEVRVIGVGVLVGIAGAFAATRVLSAWLFGITPTDPLTFGAVALVLGAAALLATLLPARRAARIDPAGALRSD